MQATPTGSGDAPGAGSAGRRPGRDDGIAAVIAALVGLLALLVAGYTAYLQREQVKAQVWPYLIGVNSGARNQLAWLNKGVGPAIVRSVEVTVDGQPQRDWESVMGSLGVRPLAYQQSFLTGNVVSPGESVEWLVFDDARQYATFQAAARAHRLDVVVCYCSTLGECWLTRKADVDRRAVDACPVLPQGRQFLQ